MNKLYVSALAASLIAGATMAQHQDRPLRTGDTDVRHNDITPELSTDRAILWSDDLSNAGNWTITNDPNGFDVDWEIGIGIESTGQYGTPAIESSTAANGYAMLNSDGGNNPGDVYEQSFLTTTNSIDLSLYPNVILEFQTQYRRFNNEQTYIAISTDGVNFPVPPSDTATVGLPNGLYPVWFDGELTQSVSPGNPTLKRINISSSAGGQGTVWVRFYWYGVWGYAWYVDDVNIFEQFPFDVGLESSYISHTGTGDEFGRVPATQLGTTLNVGGSVTNFGVNAQTNVVLHVETRDGSNAVVLTHNSAAFDLAPEENVFVDDEVTIPAWAADTYSSTVWLTSDQSASDGDIVNDTLERVFQVTDGLIGEYSLDGLDVYPADDLVLTSMGTNSFTDNPDEMYCMTNYFVEENFTAYGIYVGVTSNSVEGALMIASIHDTASVYADDVSAPYVTSSDHTLTQSEIDANAVIIPFTQPFLLEPGNGWMAAVSLFSNTNTTDVRVLDDLTIPQPGISSWIYLPNGTPNGSFTNGNAFVVRLLGDPTIGMEEREELSGVSVFPNPTNGLVNVIFTVQGNYQVEVINGLGEVVVTRRFNGNNTMNLSDLAKGTYSVRISNEKAASVQRVTLN